MQNQEIIFAEIETNSNKKIAVARLNQPKTLNALSGGMIKSLTQQLKEWQKDSDIVAVWLESTSEKAFCAGGNLLEVYIGRQTFKDDKEFSQKINQYFRAEYQLDYLIHTYSKPLFVFGRGLVFGGGMGLMQGAKHRIVTDNSTLAMPETKIGLFPDVGATYFYNKLPLYLTLFLSLSGIGINAKDALLLGLADNYLPEDEHENLFDLLIKLDWSSQLDVDRQIQSFFDKFTLNLESQIMPVLDEIQKSCTGLSDFKIIENLKNYAGENKFLQIAAKLVSKASPSSLRLTAELMRNMRNKTLEESLQVDYVVTSASATKGEFIEGIRALLIDKEQKPDWRFKRVEDVTLDWLQGFFELSEDYEPLDLED